MKTTFAVMLCVLLLLFSACAQKVNDPADVQAIKKAMDDFAKAVNANDADGVASFMTDKTIFADNHDPVIVGREAIRQSHQAFFRQMKPDLSTPVEDVRVVGDLAVARGAFTNKVTPKAQGFAPITYGGSWTVAFARQSDASWKWDWLVANSNQPAPGSTASGEDEKALFQLERDWAAANPKKDAATLERILADEFVFNADGQIQNKKQAMAEIRNNPAKIESGVNSDMKAMVFGDTAVVHGLYVEKSTTNGKDTSKQVRWTDVFVKRQGRWLCVTSYVTKATATP
jgi:uncharacterized protein (TIGR02246 family)